MALSDHIPVTPTAIVDAILAELAVFASAVPTIKRLAADDQTIEAVDRQLVGGVPAFLVACSGGPFVSEATSGQRWVQELGITILCAAGRYSSQADRLSGTDAKPGVEDLLDWATYYGMQALKGVSRVSAPRPVRHRWVRVEVGKYLAALDLTATRRVDTWEDDPATMLDDLGIVHDPTTPSDLWEDDNETPNSDMPPTTDGGVTEL